MIGKNTPTAGKKDSGFPNSDEDLNARGAKGFSVFFPDPSTQSHRLNSFHSP